MEWKSLARRDLVRRVKKRKGDCFFVSAILFMYLVFCLGGGRVRKKKKKKGVGERKDSCLCMYTIINLHTRYSLSNCVSRASIVFTCE